MFITIALSFMNAHLLATNDTFALYASTAILCAFCVFPSMSTHQPKILIASSLFFALNFTCSPLIVTSISASSLFASNTDLVLLSVFFFFFENTRFISTSNESQCISVVKQGDDLFRVWSIVVGLIDDLCGLLWFCLL